MQARDSRPDRPRNPDDVPIGNRVVPANRVDPGVGPRPGPRPSSPHPSGRVDTRTAPRFPSTQRESGIPQRYPTMPLARGGFGLPSLRRNVCPHFYVTGSRGAIPIQAPHLLKALIRQEQNVSRCQLRGGVHLEQGFVNDVCLTPRFNQCVFYEDDLSKD